MIHKTTLKILWLVSVATFFQANFLSAKPAAKGQVSFEWLSSEKPVTDFLSTKAFTKPNNNKNTIAKKSLNFSGHLKFSLIENADTFNLLKDGYEMANSNLIKVKTLPEIKFNFTQYADFMIPQKRTIQISSHPGWEWQISPGAIWTEKTDKGYSRIVFPFALQEKNANCTHNGLLMFLINPRGKTSNGIFQIASETCGYFQFNWVGRIKVEFKQKPTFNQQQIINNFQHELKNKILSHSSSTLKRDYPQININKLLPKYALGSTTSGIVIKGKHYSLNCGTRYGDYPYCDWLALPSYSTAKSIFAGIGLMRLQALVPDVDKILVTKMIPECSEEKWKNVTLADLLNMRTGNYVSRNPHIDEASSKMLQFFLATTHQQKLHAACTMFPHKSPPGKRFNYHTSDTYLAGVMLNNIFSKLSGKKDFYKVILAGELWPMIKLSPLMDESKRTYDPQRQAFTGWGLTYYVDDVIKIVNFLQRQVNTSAANQVIDNKLLKTALLINKDGVNLDGGTASLAYNIGFWGLEVSSILRCKKLKWIPLMSGYGGITVALISPDILYYNYADDYKFEWLGVVKELNKQFNLCEAT